MKLALLGGVVLALTLTGCATKKQATEETSATQSTTLSQASQPHQSVVTKFECNNGLTVTVKTLADDKIYLTTQKYTATMALAPAGSGERYVATQGLFGYGGEWHQKGNEAVFSYKGVHGANGQTSCNLTH